MSFIYKVYTRKTIEGLINTEAAVREEIKHIGEYPEKVQSFLYNFERGTPSIINDRQKLENANKDNKIAQEFGITTVQYYEKYPDDFTMDRKKASELAEELGKRRKNKIKIVKNEEYIHDEYTTSDFLNVTCETCDDVKNAYGGIGCALYYKPNGDSNLTLYYKKTDESYNIKVSEDLKSERITNKGHLITKRSKCKEIKSLEKCKQVKSCKDIRGSAENRKNCVFCENPISNGTYDVYKTYPNENLMQTLPKELKVQKGFPKDWESKGYKCEQDYGPFDLEGCKRGACAENYNPSGPKTAECYSELYRDNGGVGPPKEKEWWNKNAMNQQPINFNGYIKESEDGEFKWENPDGNFQSIVANISSKTKIEKEDYDSAKKAYIFKNGQVDKNKIQDFACEHQERTNKPNIDCQLKKEREVRLETTAVGSFYKGNYKIENFSNLREGYTCTDTNEANYINSNIGGKIKEYFDKFINELSVNFSTTAYENVLKDKKKIKDLGRGDKKQAALRLFGKEINIEKPKKGDHVQFSLNNKIVKGVVVEIENKMINNSKKTMALCIWDYYKGNGGEHYRRGYSVCNEKKFKSENPDGIYNNSDCIDGVTSKFDTERTNCLEKNSSCELINRTFYSDGNLGSYKNMSDSLMGEMLKDSSFPDVEKKLWKEEGWIDIDELERLHICQNVKCKKGYFSCSNTVNNYINL